MSKKQLAIWRVFAMSLKVNCNVCGERGSGVRYTWWLSILQT